MIDSVGLFAIEPKGQHGQVVFAKASGFFMGIFCLIYIM